MGKQKHRYIEILENALGKPKMRGDVYEWSRADGMKLKVEFLASNQIEYFIGKQGAGVSADVISDEGVHGIVSAFRNAGFILGGY